MVITDEVEEAVDKQALHLLVKSASIFCRLTKGSLGAYHYISQQYRRPYRDFPEAVVHRKREYVSGPVYAAIKVIELLHTPVINKQYPEFSSLEIE